MAGFNWFPGHMAAAFHKIQSVVKHCSMVVEVRDARVPLSAENPKLQAMLRNKPTLVALNKVDIADAGMARAHAELLHGQRVKVLCTSCPQKNPGAAQLLQLLTEEARARGTSTPTSMHVLMVVGLPNSGKSSLINALKREAKDRGALSGVQAHNKTSVTGPTPGLTRQVTSFQVLEAPPIWVMDTPGIMPPSLRSHDQAMKLALVGAIKDGIPGEEAVVAHFLQMVHGSKALQQVLAGTIDSGKPSLSFKHYPGMPFEQAAAKAAEVHRKARRLAEALLRAATGPSAAEGPWHPGMEDDAEDAGGGDGGSQRLQLYYELMGVAGLRDPSNQTGACLQALKALRTGALGRFCFDPVPVVAPAAAARG